MKKLRTIQVGAALVVVLMSVAPTAQAAFGYGEQSVKEGSETAYGKGSLTVAFTTAKNNAQVKTASLNGKAAYITATFWNAAGNRIRVQSKSTTSTSWKNVTKSGVFGAPTAAPWYGAVKTCVSVPWWFDPCSGENSGRVA
jgi:hypothetical protein